MGINELSELKIQLTRSDDSFAVGDCVAVVFRQPYIESLETFISEPGSGRTVDDFYQPFPDSPDWAYSVAS